TAHKHGRPVELNIYDLIQQNYFLFDVGLGVLHSGVVVDGKEYSYGGGGGIVVSRPRSVEGAEYRETIFMGTTYLSDKQIRDVIHDLKKTYTGDNYQMIQHNCNNFSNDFCKILVGKEIPSYVNRCAAIANWVSGVASNVATLVDKLEIPTPQLNNKEKT
ncbi:hypothetical protein WA538_003897, partial [Blastocystis sp. DL]